MFTLSDRLFIKNPTIKVDQLETKGCFLYNFKEGGFSKELFTHWLDGKLMDIYEFNGHFNPSSKCPWCSAPFHFECDLKLHGKRLADVNTIKISQKAYPILLQYLRRDNYDALLFLVHRSCQFCINPVIPGREGKCAIAESARNKPRSLKLLNLQFPGFNLKKYSQEAVAVVYCRRKVNQI